MGGFGSGTTISHYRILGKLGGGAYVALCAPAARVKMLRGAEIQMLPRKAIAGILGRTGPQQYEFSDYQAAGVAEQELDIEIL